MKRAAELLRQWLRIVSTLVRYSAAESCWFSPSVILGGHCGGDPPLSIPNRAVKPAIADGTDPPVGRVGSRRPSGARMSRYDVRALFLLAALCRTAIANAHRYTASRPQGSLMAMAVRRSRCRQCPSVRLWPVGPFVRCAHSVPPTAPRRAPPILTMGGQGPPWPSTDGSMQLKKAGSMRAGLEILAFRDYLPASLR